MITSPWLAATALQAVAMAWRPEEQKRLMVWPDTFSGSSARTATLLAMFMEVVLCCTAQPMMISSISAGSSPGTRWITPFKTWAEYSIG